MDTSVSTRQIRPSTPGELLRLTLDGGGCVRGCEASGDAARALAVRIGAGAPIGEQVHPDDRAFLEQSLSWVAAEAGRQAAILLRLSGDGGRWLVLRAVL